MRMLYTAGVVREEAPSAADTAFPAPVEAIRAVHPNVAVVAAGAVLHGAESEEDTGTIRKHPHRWVSQGPGFSGNQSVATDAYF